MALSVLTKADADKIAGEAGLKQTSNEQQVDPAALQVLQDKYEELLKIFGKQGTEVRPDPRFAYNQEQLSMIPTEIPMDDLLEEPHVFFQFSSGGGIYGYSNNSVDKHPPYGREIRFLVSSRFKRMSPSGRGEDLVSISQAVVYTQKEVDYVQGHPWYGVTIFDEMTDVETLDTRLLEITQQVAAELASYDPDR